MFWSGTNCGSLLSVSSMATLAVFWNCCAFTVTIGLLEVKSFRTMREPVTTTSPTAEGVEAAASGAAGAADWA